jgi:tetratricopeptide (TPR) repeat protein
MSISWRKIMKFKYLSVLFVLLSLMAFSSCGSSRATAPEQTANSVNVSSSDSIKKADELYAQRTDLAKLREAINILKSARASDPNNFDIVWKLSQYSYFLGDHSEDEDEVKKSFESGINFAREAITLQGDRPEGHFWLAANLGGRAKRNPLSGLTDVDEIRKSLETVIKIDEKYQGGSAYMALGQLELETSGFLLGGDKKKALEYLEKGFQINSENSILRLRLAEAYIANNRRDDARKQIDYILKMKPDPNYLPEYQDSVKEAKKLLEKIT